MFIRLLSPPGQASMLTFELYLIAGDFLVWFGFLSGIRFLWRQGRNAHREQGCPTPRVNRLRLASILVVATVCALPLSYYLLQVKLRFHSGLADTPAQVTEAFVLSTTICAIALCGIAVLGRFWPGANPDSLRTQL